MLGLTDAGVEEQPVGPSHSVLDLLQLFEIHFQLLLAANPGPGRHFNPLKVHVDVRLPLGRRRRPPLAAAAAPRPTHHTPEPLADDGPPVVPVVFV